jgi:hypothetical protein
MKWKLFSTAFISLLFFCFPENMIGCGPTEDPWDYYTSFFSNDMISQKDFKPFYYTGLLSFYTDDTEEKNSPSYNQKIIEEWRSYCKDQASATDVIALVYSSSATEIKKAIDQIKNGSAAVTNRMAKYLVTSKDQQALNYLLLAKQSEALGTSDAWASTPAKDSIAINKLISNAQALLKESKNDFLKTKFAYQLCKLAFYNSRFRDCIQWYDELLSDKSYAVQPLGLSYKAGSLFRAGRKKEAAYNFSKLFSASSLNKKDVFLGFLWSTDNCNPELENDYLSLCKSDKEKANMVAMFAMYGTQYRLAALRKLYSLDPASNLLPLLVTREISKLEEKYLTPVLSKEKGGKQYYYSWNESGDLNEDRKQLNLVLNFLQTAASATDANAGLYLTGAAYLSFIDKKFSAAKNYIEQARKISLSEKLKDQLALIDLLIAANEPQKLDALVEQNILPSLQWLFKKASNNDEYKKFLRNFLSEIIAQRYQQQGEDFRAALIYGVADSNVQWWNEGLDFVQNEMSTEQLLKLYNLFTSQKNTAYEKFMIAHSAINKNNAINTIGTSYLRDFDFSNAISWLKKATSRDTISETDYNYTSQTETPSYPDPFYDYVNDNQRYDKKSSVAYTKLSLAQKLLELKKSIETPSDKEAKSKLYYKLATALYNISFYGNSWQAVDYYRHTSQWNTGAYKAPWEKEYYGVYTARAYYQKAYELTSNKEFKAACYFLLIKCAQRQIIAPDYYSYEGIDGDPGWKEFWKQFKYNPLFSNFQKEFGNTKYFSYVSTRCSYLRDFVKKNK